MHGVSVPEAEAAAAVGGGRAEKSGVLRVEWEGRAAAMAVVAVVVEEGVVGRKEARKEAEEAKKHLPQHQEAVIKGICIELISARWTGSSRPVLRLSQ